MESKSLTMAKRMREAYVRAWGDPNSPEGKQKIDNTLRQWKAKRQKIVDDQRQELIKQQEAKINKRTTIPARKFRN